MARGAAAAALVAVALGALAGGTEARTAADLLAWHGRHPGRNTTAVSGAPPRRQSRRYETTAGDAAWRREGAALAAARHAALVAAAAAGRLADVWREVVALDDATRDALPPEVAASVRDTPAAGYGDVAVLMGVPPAVTGGGAAMLSQAEAAAAPAAALLDATAAAARGARAVHLVTVRLAGSDAWLPCT